MKDNKDQASLVPSPEIPIGTPTDRPTRVPTANKSHEPTFNPTVNPTRTVAVEAPRTTVQAPAGQSFIGERKDGPTR